MVEALDRNFKNVCELDIIFNVEQVQHVSQRVSHFHPRRTPHLCVGLLGPA